MVTRSSFECRCGWYLGTRVHSSNQDYIPVLLYGAQQTNGVGLPTVFRRVVSMEKGYGGVLLPEFEAEMLGRLAGLQGI